MKKKWIRWGAVIVLIGSITLTTWLGLGEKALALPTEQIVKTLQSVPVFVIIDDQGAPLIGVIKSDDKSKNQTFTKVFINLSDANSFLAELKQKSPDVAKKVKVQPISLGKVYEIAQNYQAKPDGLIFAYVPAQKQVEEAKKILTASGQEYKGGVPLFVARGGKEQGYITTQVSNQVIIPVFFEISLVQKIVERFKKEKPELATSAKIDVILLENFMAKLKESDDKNLTKFVLVPSEESIKAAQSAENKAPTPAPTK